MTSPYAENVKNEMDGIIARDYFISAFRRPELEIKVREREPVNLEQTQKAALRAEVYFRACNSDRAKDSHNKRERRDDPRVDGRYNYAVRRAEEPVESISNSSVARLKRELDEMRKKLDQTGKERDR